MIAKKRPEPDIRHAEQTRKVDSMSELVADMLLSADADADATLPPPDQSPGSLSAVRSTPRPLDRYPTSPPFVPYVYQPRPVERSSRVTNVIVVALVIGLAGAAAALAYLLTR